MKKILLTIGVAVLLGASAFAQNKPAAKQAPKTQKATAAPNTEAAKTKTTAKKSQGLTKPQAARQTSQAAASLAEWNASKSAN